MSLSRLHSTCSRSSSYCMKGFPQQILSRPWLIISRSRSCWVAFAPHVSYYCIELVYESASLFICLIDPFLLLTLTSCVLFICMLILIFFPFSVSLYPLIFLSSIKFCLLTLFLLSCFCNNWLSPGWFFFPLLAKYISRNFLKNFFFLLHSFHAGFELIWNIYGAVQGRKQWRFLRIIWSFLYELACHLERSGSIPLGMGKQRMRVGHVPPVYTSGPAVRRPWRLRTSTNWWRCRSVVL